MMKKVLCLMVCVALLGGFAHAQGVTTGSLSGVVMDPNGDPIPGVAVRAELTSTGNRFGAVTDTEGRFRIPNVKVGGPYLLDASLAGFQDAMVPNVYVRLGETTNLVIDMQLAAATAEIEIVGESSPLISPTKMGVSSSVSQASLEALPTLERSVYDMARTNPVFSLYTEGGSEPNVLSVSGRNPRYNNISIDGAVNNDVFGLADTGTPGGQTGTNPIQFDAIQELQLVTSSFDVRQGGFTGGSVNVITKSGTNQFHGSVFGYYSDDSMVGSGPASFPEFGTYEDSEYGFTFGGPIVKEKLFFFGSYGHNTYDQPTGWSLDGITGQCWRDCDYTAEAEALRQYVQSTYGYDIGGTSEQTRERPSDKILLRMDWNLNESHNFLLRYNYVDAANLINRPNNNTYEWDSQAYDFKNETNSFVGQWNAVFGATMFNELRVTYQTIRDNRNPPGVSFPWIEIENIDGDFHDWEMGSEPFSTYNSLDTDIIEITDDFTFFAGDHEIVVGTHNEFYTFKNLFIQNGFGSYQFSTLEDFYAGIAREYDYTYTNFPDDPADSFDTAQVSLYAGDTWRAKPNFTLIYGLRLDVPLFPDKPGYNEAVDDEYGVRTDSIPDGNMLWSPRIGFNWDIKGDGQSQLRGGAGLFSGRTPYVWVSNNYGRTGLRQTTIEARGEIPFNPDPFDQPEDIGGSTSEEINAIDPSFDFPQTWRANVAYDHRLPWYNLVATAEVMWAQSTNEIDYKNLNIQQTGETLPFDGRPIYERVNGDYTGVYYLTNTDKGDAFNGILKVELPYGQLPFWGIASYTYGDSNVVNDATSSRAVSNWQYNEAPDPNNAGLSTSDFEIKHRMMINLNYEFNRQSRWSTTLSLFWNHQSGKPYMSIYNWFFPSVNEDRFGSNDPIYVPSGADDVVITNGTWDQLETYLERTGIDGYGGKISPRNPYTTPWITQTDLSVRQNIPIPGRSSLQVSLDILNFWNMIDNSSGHVLYVPFGTQTPISYEGVTDDGKPIYELRNVVTDPENTDLYTIDDLRSRWRMRLGLRWSF